MAYHVAHPPAAVYCAAMRPEARPDPHPPIPAPPAAVTPAPAVLAAAPDAGAVLERLLADLAPRTRKTYTEHLTLAARWYGVPLALLPAALVARGRGGARLAVEAYRDALRDRTCMGASGRPVSNGYVNVAVSALQAVVRKAYQLDLIDWTVQVKRLKPAKPDMRGPGVPAVRRLLAAAAADPNPVRAARDAALLRLLYDRAVRLAEALTLDAAHLEFGPAASGLGGVPVAARVAGKGGDGARERLTLAPQTSVALAHWLAQRNARLGADPLGTPAPGPLFLSLDRRLRGAPARLTGRAVEKRLGELAARAGVAQACRPHGLRHTAATRALEDGVPVQEVALYTRHARVQTLLDHYFDVVVDVGGKVAARVAAHV